MTIWVIYQDTDFCQTLWEERFYNAIVGVIYCFCFFNLKEGRSRYRAAIFYSIIITENLAFLGVYYWVTEKEWMGIGAVGIVLLGTALGMTSMLLYYGYFHPGGKIRMCVERESYDFEKSETASSSPDFVIHDNSKYATPFKKINSLSPSSLSGKPSDKPKIQHSRSFKRPCPPKRRFSPRKDDAYDADSPRDNKPDSAYGTDSSQTMSRNALNESEGSFSPNNETYMSIEKSTPMAASTVLEDNNESIESSTTYMAIRSSSSQGNQPEKNDTYMSLNSPILINSSQEDSTISNESLITVINRKNTLLARSHQAAKANIANSEKVLLKRSPVVKDITSGYAQISPIDKVVSQQKKRDFTIIVPPFPRLRRTEPLDPPKLPPKASFGGRGQIVESGSEGLVVELGPHDYENMALVNINRGAFGVSHWKPYSDMANYQHDDSSSSERKPCNTSSSTDYESMHYYDVYPLSKRLQDKLVKNLAPATPESDTYEPIEVFEPGREEEPNEAREEEDDYELRVPVPITLIHHDGDKVITKRVMSMENLKDVISKHETVPMDDPQDRSDLYLLAPMRLLEPILEESEPGDLSRTSSYNNRSIMTVLSDFLNKTYASASSSAVYHPCPDGRFHESSESGGSSLVQTIEEIRNQSLYSSEPKPKIPPRMEVVPPDPHRDKKVPISTSVGSRKNILDLAGDSTSNLLNTPNKRKDDHHSNQDSSLALSPSVKYEVSSSSNGTPTPPPFSRHVSNRAPCGRKCSIIREHRYQEQSNSSTSLRPDEKYEPPPIAQRGSWNISSLQPRSYISESALSQRNIASRRSLSILDDKENEGPPSHIGRPLAPKPTGRRHISPLTNIGSLSPNSRIFSQDV